MESRTTSSWRERVGKCGRIRLGTRWRSFVWSFTNLSRNIAHFVLDVSGPGFPIYHEHGNWNFHVAPTPGVGGVRGNTARAFFAL